MKNALKPIIGRQDEIELLLRDYHLKKSSLIVGYGRRRIGKSFLFQHHIQKLPSLSFEGIENQSPQVQIQHFVQVIYATGSIKKMTRKKNYSWEEALDLLTSFLKSQKKKTVIFFDEFQWMASGRSSLPALLKKYWDNDWKNYSCQLILCGSVSSYMVGKVIRSKALYGRINIEMNIKQLPPNEAQLFFKKDNTALETMKYLLVFGGVPKYLSDIEQNLSFEQNLCNFFFDRHSSYIQEYEKIFYSQFKEHEVYEKIVAGLVNGPKTLKDFAKIVNMKSGGGLKSYLLNLERAQFIKSYSLVPNAKRTRVIQYRLLDPFLRFYFFFVKNNTELIENSSNPKKTMDKIVKNKMDLFLGLAFENFGLLFATYLAQKLGIEDFVLRWGPLQSPHVQVDLLYVRNDMTINICEFKFGTQEITTKIIPEIELKLAKVKELFPDYSIQKSLICTGKVQKALVACQYFDQILINPMKPFFIEN